jgi:hypothetical protein
MMAKTVIDELESIVRMFSEKNPDRSTEEIDLLVHDVYSGLASGATVTAHLIPLKVNRCHKVLKRRVHSVDGVLTPINPVTVAS